MAHPSQRDDLAPGNSRLATPPPDSGPGAEPFLPRDNPKSSDNPKFLHAATPRKAKISNIGALHKHKGYYTQMGNREMENRYAQVGLDTFFEKYLPKPAKELSEPQLKKIGNFSHVPYSGAEEPMYAPLCDTFQKLREAINSPYIMLDTSGPFDQANEIQVMKPGLSLYDGTHGRTKYQIDDVKRMSSKVRDERRREHLGRTAWAWMVSFIEVKETDEGERSRAQVIKYVSEIQRRQHRTFVLCAFIWRDWVRFMRWDRAGAIVSAAVNYVENPQRLLDFVHRISTSSPEGQGYDPTVKLVDLPKAEIRSRLLTYQKYLTRLHQINFFREAFEIDMDDYPLYELTCEDVSYRAEDRQAAKEENRESTPSEPRTYSYWISKIHASTRSPTGRGTRGYVAFDIDHRQVVFLKDYWCPNLKGIHPELETYARLRASSVRYVATALAGGRVVASNRQLQTTVTQEILKKIPHGEHIIVPPEAFHYRFVVREIGQPLEEYECAADLWRILASGIVGHQDAYEKANVLHRDISAKNILINPLTKKALIIDWDLAKYMDANTTLQSSQSGRSGTWPFMSAKLLQLPRKPNELADDLESFIYVLCVMFLCYHDHSMSPTKPDGTKDFSLERNSRNTCLSQHLDFTFYSNIVSGRYHYGGDWKLSQIREGSPKFTMSDETLNLLISKLYKLLQQHYDAFPVDELRATWGIPVLPAAAPAVPRKTRTMRQRHRLTRGDNFDPTVYQTTRTKPVARVPSASSSAPAGGSTQNTTFLGLRTHKLILGVFFADDILDAEWADDDKTFSQFVGLPNPDGTNGTKVLVASSLGGSSAGGLKHELELDEGDEKPRDLKKRRTQGPTSP